jgi:diguanylate cyclase (GGDEF)-like protein
MLIQPLSLRVLTGLVVLVMGVLGMSLALVTGEIHHRLTLDNQRQGLADLAGLAAGEALDRQEEKARSLGLGLQSTPAFEQALRAGDFTAITHLLDDQFHQYFVTAGEIRLLQLRLFSPEFELLAEASEGLRSFPSGRAACPGLLEAAAGRQGTQRLRSLPALCADPLPLHSLIVPVGGLFLRGYVEVVVDPSLGLERLEHTLGMPLRLQAVTGADLYHSASWPEGDHSHDAFAVDYILRGDGGHEVLRLTLLSDISALRERLGETRRNILLVATLLTLWVAALLYWVLRRTTLDPLRGLLRQMQSHQHDETSRKAASSVAIRELHALRNIYDTLDQLAHTDSLTLLPNRAQFRECLENHSARDHRQAGGFALLIMDLDGFKRVNDRYGHQAGDELLHQVAARLAASKRGGDILARLGGDEFGMLLPAVTEWKTASAVADKLLQTLQEPFRIGTHQCQVGLSIGIAFYPKDATDPDGLISLADAAMYEAKRSGSGYAYASEEVL